jgi:hypothetical protein
MSEASKRRGGVHIPKRRGKVKDQAHKPLSDPKRRPTRKCESTQNPRGGRAHVGSDDGQAREPLYRSVEKLYQGLQRFAKEHAEHLSHAEQTWLSQALGQIELSLIKVSPALASRARPLRQDTDS